MVRDNIVDYISTGKRVKNARIEQDLSQETLAAKADISVQFLNNVENAKSKVSLETLDKIADALNLRIDDLLCDNLYKNEIDYKKQLTELLSDCSDYEKRVIVDTLLALKSAIRQSETFKK